MGGQKGIALFYRYVSKEAKLTALTTRNNQSSEDYPVLPLLSNHPSRYLNPGVLFTLKKLIRTSGAEYLLFEHPYYAWLIQLCRWFTSCQIIVHSHNIESERFRSVGKSWWRILWHYEKWAYRVADRVWFKTEEDRQYAIQQFGLGTEKTRVVPYGIEPDALPAREEIEAARKQLRALYHIPPGEKILLFNGTLNYKPNLDALKHLLTDILPRLREKNLPVRLLVCGKNLPADMNELTTYKELGVIYAGFVDDIDLYFKACDVFLNPLLDGGGIKTKLVEALGFGNMAVSSSNGAIGVDPSITGGRLKVVADFDWDRFAEEVQQALHETPEGDHQLFYQHFSWKNIAHQALQSLDEPVHD